MTRKLFLFLASLFFIAALVLAYPVGIKIQSNTNINTTVYHCQDSTCSLLDSNAYTSIFGTTNIYSVAKLGAGTQYFAEYDFTLDRCYTPHSYMRWFNENTGNGPWTYTLTFSKKACNASIVSYSQSDNITIGTSQLISVMARSPLNPPAGSPAALPANLETYYSASVKANLEVRNSSGSLIYSNTLNKDILGGKQDSFNFSFTPSEAGIYSVVLNVYSDECMCSSSVVNSKNTNFNVAPLPDVIPPYVAFISPISKMYNTSLISVELNYSSDATSVFWDNGTANLSYSSPVSLNLTDGNYAFFAYARDAAGNLNSSSVSFSVNTSVIPPINDTLAPELKIISPENKVYNFSSILINISAKDTNLDSVWFNLGAGNISYNSPVYMNFTDGNYFLTAYANDSYGNTNSSSVSFSVNTSVPVNDTIPPFIGFISPENKTYNDSVVHIELNYSADAASVFWDNGTANLSYSSPLNYVFANGSHTLFAYARDAAGNLNSMSVSFAISLPGNVTNDTIPPVITVISPESKEYSSSEILFNISTSEACLDAWISINGQNYTMRAASSMSFFLTKSLADGSYSVIFYARYAAGNIGKFEINFSVNTNSGDDSGYDSGDDSGRNTVRDVNFGEQISAGDRIITLGNLTNLTSSTAKQEQNDFTFTIILSLAVLLALILILVVLLSRR